MKTSELLFYEHNFMLFMILYFDLYITYSRGNLFFVYYQSYPSCGTFSFTSLDFEISFGFLSGAGTDRKIIPQIIQETVMYNLELFPFRFPPDKNSSAHLTSRQESLLDQYRCLLLVKELL